MYTENLKGENSATLFHSAVFRPGFRRLIFKIVLWSTPSLHKLILLELINGREWVLVSL